MSKNPFYMDFVHNPYGGVMAKMYGIQKTRPEKGAELVEVDIPSPGKHEVLVKVKATSICGTDLHIYEWDAWASSRLKLPLVFGHEFAGEVVEVGEDVSKVEKGDMVSAETHIACGKCYQCRTGNAHVCENVKILGVDTQGCFAEYVVLPEDNAWINSKDMPPEIASVQEPFGNAVHTVFSGTDDVAGSKAVVIGCGPIGIFAIMILRAAGASKIIALEVNDYRIKLAEKAQPDVILNPKEDAVVRTIMEETHGRGADIVLEMSGNGQALQQGLQYLRTGGRLSILGIFSRPVELDVTNGIVFKAATIHGINGRLMFETWYRTAELINSGLVDPGLIITHKFGLKDFHKGFEVLEQGQAGKVVLYP
jgi:threonine 3-dehydrogenase